MNDFRKIERQAELPITAWSPLVIRAFRAMWIVWLASNIGMWMSDVTTAWLMTSLTSSTVMVALVQSALTLPIFLFGLPSGTLADRLDRRTYALLTQVWTGMVGFAMTAALLAGWMSPALLLAFTFLNGLGFAMRWPIYASIVPQLVPRLQLPGALALNSIAFNASRILGPTLAGALIAAQGMTAVFALNAVVSLLMIPLILRWPPLRRVAAVPGDGFIRSMSEGAKHVRSNAAMRAVLLRIFIFFFHSAALVSLLPVLARELSSGEANEFTWMLASMGAGAIIAAALIPRLRKRLTANQLLVQGGLLHALSTVAIGYAPSAFIAIPALVACGMAWLVLSNVVTLAAQLALPDWVRARGMAFYMMAIMGSAALGAAVWGQVANLTSVREAFLISLLSSVTALVLCRQVRVGDL
ncbi:H+ Antiporter protein [compost metagenome]